MLREITNSLNSQPILSSLSFHVYLSRRNLFESKAEDYALKKFVSSPYAMSLQADMVLEDPGYDSKVRQIFHENPDIFMISGRGTHIWEIPEKIPSLATTFRVLLTSFLRICFTLKATEIEAQLPVTQILNENSFFSEDFFGRTGSGHSDSIEVNKEAVFLSETVMRGPLIFRMAQFRLLGGLDWKRHRLGNDDHELSLRAWNEASLRTAYYPANYISPLDWGTSRRQKSIFDAIAFVIMRFSEKIHHFSTCPLSAASRNLEKPVKEVRYFRNGI